jgi:hypothetical protein
VIRLGWTLIRWELNTWRSLWLVLRRRDDSVGAGDTAVGYASALTPMMVAILAVSMLEVAGMHVLIPWPRPRLVLDVLGIWSIAMISGIWAGYSRHPHVLRENEFLIRNGTHVAVVAPLGVIESARLKPGHAYTTAQVVDDTLHLPIAGSTALLIELREPVTARLGHDRTALVTSIAVAADDPDGLLHALNARLAQDEKKRFENPPRRL